MSVGQRQRILLVNPSMGGYYAQSRVKRAITQSPPLNLAVIAAGLVRSGHEVRVLDLDGEPWRRDELTDLVTDYRPGMVGFTFRTPIFKEATSLATLVRQRAPRALVVAGGVHPSVRPHEVLATGVFDVACINEGDDTVLELVSAIHDRAALKDIRGIVWHHQGETISNPERGQVEDLDRLPFPAWELFNLSRYHKRSLVARHRPVADLESSRGCPAHCIYCTRTLFGEGFRGKTPPRFVDEVEHAIRAGFRQFNLVDDSFTTDIKRAVQICDELIRRRITIPWTLTNGIRVGHTNEEFFIKAKRAGLYLLAFGLETGDQQILNTVGKGATLNQARKAVAWARAQDMTILGYFMVGLPGETPETLEKTLAFARELDLDYAKFSITVPLPGTELFEMWQEYIEEDRYHGFNIHSASRNAFRNPGISWDHIEIFLKRAYRSYYWRPEYLLKRVTRDLRHGDLLFNTRIALETDW